MELAWLKRINSNHGITFAEISLGLELLLPASFKLSKIRLRRTSETRKDDRAIEEKREIYFKIGFPERKRAEGKGSGRNSYFKIGIPLGKFA